MKDESQGKVQCLEGLTIVCSGLFNEISRDKLEQLIAEYGGRCTGSISGKTDYLIIGYKLEDGRDVTQGGKYKNAQKKGTKILEEQGFEQSFRCAWITLRVNSDLEAVGLTAAFARALADQSIACNVIAGAYHDHLFVPVDRAADALHCLQQLQRRSTGG